MTKFSGWAALAALIAVPCLAHAQDYGADRPGGPTGGFELEYIGTEHKGTAFLDGDIDLMQRGLPAGMWSLGFDLGVDATFDLSKGTDRYAFFGAVVVDPGFGEIAVGAPRSIGSLLIDRPVFAGNQSRDRDLETVFPPMSDALAKSQRKQSYGVRFDSTSGAVRYGASLQKINSLDGMFLQAGAEYSFGQGAVEGLLEKRTNTDGLNLTVGVSGLSQQVDYALYLGHQDGATDSTGVQAGLGYTVSDSLRVGGDLGLRQTPTDESTYYGASAEYSFDSGVRAQIGVSDGNDTRVMWDASIGFEF
jgi:hypothetical protein